MVQYFLKENFMFGKSCLKMPKSFVKIWALTFYALTFSLIAFVVAVAVAQLRKRKKRHIRRKYKNEICRNPNGLCGGSESISFRFDLNIISKFYSIFRVTTYRAHRAHQIWICIQHTKIYDSCRVLFVRVSHSRNTNYRIRRFVFGFMSPATLMFCFYTFVVFCAIPAKLQFPKWWPRSWWHPIKFGKHVFESVFCIGPIIHNGMKKQLRSIIM